ncbi:hypothetical protein GCM10023195_77920 [Actinoallomurus liliacearum]|uniref:SseB protein N-terminal domain-containing protein n=1 Tax=Actinoallomurus liliacearum TaxID=1080073 RepID=A0ABP8TXA8_9ACTN
MTDTWEPANQLEQQLGEVLRAGDQNAYFRLLSVAELVVPVPQTEPDASGQPAFTWPTSVHEGRTHVLAYTSVESARRHLGPGYEQFVRMSLVEMAQSWPDADWWLAVNSGMPIEAYLPAWFLNQITADQVRAEQRPHAQEAAPTPAAQPVPAPEPGTAPAGHDAEGVAHAAPGGHDTGPYAAPGVQDSGLDPRPAPDGTDPATGGHPAPGGQDTGLDPHALPGGTDPATGGYPTPVGQDTDLDPRPAPGGTDPATGGYPAPGGQDTGLDLRPIPDGTGPATGGYPAPGGQDSGLGSHAIPGGSGPATGAHAAPGGDEAGSQPTTAWPATIIDVHTASGVYDAPGSQPAPADQHAAPPAPPAAETAPAPVQPAEPQSPDPSFAPRPAGDVPTVSWPDVHQPVPGGTPPAPDAPDPGIPSAPPDGPAPAPGPDTSPPSGDGTRPYLSYATASAVPPAPGTPPLAETAPQPVISGDEPMPAGPDETAVAAEPPPDAAARVPSSDAPLTPHFTAGAEFVPLDEEERLLHDAAARDDRDGFLRTLLGVRQIWVPMVEGGDLMLGPGRPGFQWYTRESGGRTVVPLFTGPSRMREAMGGHPFVLSDLAKVLRFWPDPAWDLVINDGSPIGATIPGERIIALSRQVDDAAAERLTSDFPAQNDAERRLFEARNDPAMRLTALLEASVFLPVWSRTPPTVQTPPNDPAFPWSAVPVRGRTSLLVFTSFDWMKEAVGTTGFVMPKFTDLIAAWPEPSWDVSVNPGTPIEIALSAEEIAAIAGRSAAPPPEAAPGGVPQDTAAEAPQATVTPQPEPAAVVEAPSAPAEVPPAEPQAAPLPEPAPQPPVAAPPVAESGFTIMQKVVAHDQVPWYLEKAYDRVAGFVYRVPDVIDLNTPRRLYECLGLIRDGAPFTGDDPEVHVIRWPAYRAGLYRTPFGGTSEDALKEWGEDGWVVEAPPFTGDGFASGSAGSIPEYKVESFRLPHGSEMYAISSDGSERFVARYDADRLVWENEK